MPTAMNAANEIAVSLFMNGRIPFVQIEDIVERVMDAHQTNLNTQFRSNFRNGFTYSKNGVCYGRMSFLESTLRSVKVVFHGNRNCVYSHIRFSCHFS